jgi:hypothetical protein
MTAMTHTYTRTFNLLDPWAETTPWDNCPPGCPGPHCHPGELCAVPDCGNLLRAREACYAVVELPSDTRRLAWVCWRHVRPDQGPVRI